MVRKYLTSTRVMVPGLRRRVRILHLTDLHLCRVDAGDALAAAQRKRVKQIKSGGANPEARAKELLGKLSPKDFDAVVLTGDLVDFVSRASIRWAAKILKSCRVPLYFMGGNHDSTFPTDTWWKMAEPAAKLERWDVLGDLRPKSCVRWEIKGLQFLGFDDARYQMDAQQVAFARKHLATGQPTVIALHIPLTQPRLKALTVIRWRKEILLGESFSQEDRAKWLIDPPSRETRRFLELVRRAKNVRAILAGHVHFGFEEQYSATAVQLVGPPGFDGAFRIVEFEPAGA